MMKNNNISLRHFTFVEMMIVVSVIGILIGILGPSLAKIKSKAKYLRWTAFQNEVNMDEDTLINYDFEFDNFSVLYNGATTPALYNGANSNKNYGYSQSAYHGILEGDPEWAVGGGRWDYKNSLIFDGRNDCAILSSSKLLNMDPGTDDFSFTSWVKFDETGIQYLFSKAKNIKKSQYNFSYNGSKIAVGAGGVLNQWDYTLEPDKWYHVALVNEAGTTPKVYINGELVSTAMGSSGIPEEAIYDAKFTLGAMGGENDNPRQFFSGQMDEFMAFDRALQPAEIKRHYELGNPY